MPETDPTPTARNRYPSLAAADATTATPGPPCSRCGYVELDPGVVGAVVGGLCWRCRHQEAIDAQRAGRVRVGPLGYPEGLGAGDAAAHETTATISAWCVATFGKPDAKAAALRILDECAELCIAAGVDVMDMTGVVMDRYNKYFDCPKSPYLSRPDPAAIPAELADIRITVCHAAAALGTDHDADVDLKMRTNRHKRTWIPNGDGTAQHRPTEGDE